MRSSALIGAGSMIRSMTALENSRQRKSLCKSTSVFRTFIKTLVKAGLITGRTAPKYAAFVDMEELHVEGDRQIGDEIADEGIRALREINKTGGLFVSLNAAE